MKLAALVNNCVLAFCAGVKDTFSLHRTAQFVVNSSSVRQEVGMTFMANGFLLLGSVFLYKYFIEPVADMMSEFTGSSSAESRLTGVSVWSFYHLLWVVPVWGLCYVVSLGCYQTISDDVFRIQVDNERKNVNGTSCLLRETSNNSDVKRTISGTIYATIVWAYIFAQMRVIDSIFPFILSHTAQLIDIGVNFAVSSPSLASLSSYVVTYPLMFTSAMMRVFGLLFAGVVYGWYGFDMVWISGGLQPSQRFRLVEENWAYFCGFGLPYAVLLKSTSFFLGYGLYLMLFPFTLMLGAVSDFRLHSNIPSLDMFGPAQRLALSTVKLIDQRLRPSKRKKLS